METLHGPVNSEGLFTPISPIQHKFSLPDVADCCWNRDEGIEHYKWMEQHPPALCYNSDNQLIRGLNDVEVTGPVWQWKNYANLWLKCDDNLDVQNAQRGGKETRQIYLTVPPSEKADSKETLHTEKADAQPVKEVDKWVYGAQITFGDSAFIKLQNGLIQCIAQSDVCELSVEEIERLYKWTRPVSKEVKTAAEIMYQHECYQGQRHLYFYEEVIRIANAYHSQFATEAGGGKDIQLGYEPNICIVCDEDTGNKSFCADCGLNKAEDRPIEQLTDEYCSNMGYIQSTMVRNMAEYFFNKGLSSRDAATTPNNLVDVEEVIKVILDWWHASNPNKKDIIINQIKSLSK